MLQEILQNRPRIQRVARLVANKYVPQWEYIQIDGNSAMGIVTPNYPLFFSDTEMISELMQIIHDIGLNVRSGHTSVYKNGTVYASWWFTDPEFELSYDATRIYLELTMARQGVGWFEEHKSNLGFFYLNNRYGFEALKIDTYIWKELCSNGAKVAVTMPLLWIAHQNLNSFLDNAIKEMNKIRQLLKTSRTDIPMELPPPRNKDWYLTRLDIFMRDLARYGLFRVLANSPHLKDRHRRAYQLVVDDWQSEVFSWADAFKLPNDMKNILKEVAHKEPTLKMLDDLPATMYDIADIYTSTANYMGLQTPQGVLLQEIGGEILINNEPRTKYNDTQGMFKK